MDLFVNKVISALLAGGLVSFGAASGTADRSTPPRPAPTTLVVQFERELPPGLYGDIRWLDDQTVALTTGKSGLQSLRVDAADAPPNVVVPGGAGRAAFRVAVDVAVSERFIAIGGRIFQFTWFDRLAQKLEPPRALETVLDLDLFDDRLLVLGAEKGKEIMVPDGAIAWIGSVTKAMADRKPVHFSEDGPGAPRMYCSPVGFGAVRFLADGSFVIVPGVEPGVFWYEPDGKLRRTWETSTLGIDDACPDDEKKRDEISAFPAPRIAWLKKHRIVDDVIALPSGPGLIVRDPQPNGETRWRLLALARDGAFKTWSVPITATAPVAHLTADVRGERIAFVTFVLALEDPAPIPRLVVTDLPK
jgi:hypothetical protein